MRISPFAVLTGYAILGAGACSRVRDVPLDQLPRLTAEVRASRPVAIRTYDGKEVEIQSFSRLAIVQEYCSTPTYCVPRTALVADHPLRASLYPDRVVIETAGRKAAYRGSTEQFVPLDGSKTWARVSERSFSRGATVSGVAAGVGLVVGVSAFLLVRSNSQDPHGLQPMLAGVLLAPAAGAATLPFTLSATRDLGTEL